MDDERRKALQDLRIDREGTDPARPRAWPRFLVLAVAAALALGGLAFWLAAQRAVPVTTAAVVESSGAAGGRPAVLNASGYVTARRQATVSSKVTGKVAEVLIEEGMQVEAGQVLARLDDSQARLAVGLAEARLGAAGKA
ncbi:MAG: biotin/lipoyl-binding protein, partial [Thermoanaerobaculia bacterium]